MIDPIDLFNECLEHPEPFSSKEYYNTKPIITDKKINDLNKEIFLKLKEFFEAEDDNNKIKIASSIDELLLKDKKLDVNQLPFVSFFQTRDMSYSVYEKGKPDQRRNFLLEIIPDFKSTRRYELYKDVSDVMVPIQTSKDRGSHRASAKFIKRKFDHMFKKYNYLNNKEITQKFDKNIFWSIDKKKTIPLLKNHFNLDHYDNWTKQGKIEDKKADYAVLKKNTLFLLECKHQKEEGGGQSGSWGQLNDIVNCEAINCSSNHLNISYVGFLDGNGFNKIIEDAKLKEVIAGILKKNKSHNYFVNTWGLEQLIK